jgi:heme-degrading monooxygenase HmoA
MVSAKVRPGDIDAVVTAWKTTVAPSVPKQAGFRGARLLVNRATGAIRSLGLWESEAAFEATVAWNQEQLAKFTG